jgi:hypothetical protein
MDAPQRNDCQSSYDQVADEYARRLFDELQRRSTGSCSTALPPACGMPVRRATWVARRSSSGSPIPPILSTRAGGRMSSPGDRGQAHDYR